ncbi:hypothetical protein AVEN_158161-1 [Araneus ventricosus]|uniref:Uncharacterized protein n=1 Tax=Araneus ventricosus TaxID=182803 RepID=A0A4Y2I6H5_ARAVE|nr:hypothetical protein AVEN_158161-1 [Araneus ventricosus]
MIANRVSDNSSGTLNRMYLQIKLFPLVHNVLPKVETTPTPWQRPEIMFVTGHGPFPSYLKRFKIRNSDSCGCENPYTMLQAACLQLHTT